MSTLEHPASPVKSRGGRHQLKRSISELTSPGRLYRNPVTSLQLNLQDGSSRSARQQQPQQQQQQHHLHRKDRAYDKRASVQSTSAVVSRMRHSLEIPRSNGITPLVSPVQSRRASIFLQGDEDASGEASEQVQRHERENASQRADGLKQSLMDLSDFSTVATRRFDETYFAVLEKMSALQNNIAALKDLAVTSHQLYRTFDKESQGLESDIVRQLSAVGQFGGQQSKIDSLQSRIRVGRERIRSLSSRVEAVRVRIESWERADGQWQEKTRKRLRIIWSVMSVILTTLIAVLVGINYTYSRGGLDVPSRMRVAEPALGTNMSDYTCFEAPEPTWLFSPEVPTCRATRLSHQGTW